MFTAGGAAALLDRQQLQADLLFDLAGDFRMLQQEGADIVLALADALALIAVPGTGLVDDPCWLPSSMISPSREMPTPYMISNSASRNGGETLFLTTLTRVMLPTTSSPFLMAPMRRMSRRTEA